MPDNVSSSNLSKVQRFYASSMEGTQFPLGDFLGTDFVGHEAASLPYAGRYEGEAGLLQLMANIAETWSEIAASDFEYVASGEAVVAAFRLQATSRATGRSIDQRVSEFWKLRDGKAVSLQVFYYDSHLVREACRTD